MVCVTFLNLGFINAAPNPAYKENSLWPYEPSQTDFGTYNDFQLQNPEPQLLEPDSFDYNQQSNTGPVDFSILSSKIPANGRPYPPYNMVPPHQQAQHMFLAEPFETSNQLYQAPFPSLNSPFPGPQPIKNIIVPQQFIQPLKPEFENQFKHGPIQFYPNGPPFNPVPAQYIPAIPSYQVPGFNPFDEQVQPASPFDMPNPSNPEIILIIQLIGGNYPIGDVDATDSGT